MPSIDRDASRDRDLRHQNSFSETGRLSVPMWDSADPDRCPPPLPIPPSSPGLQTKPNTSAGIQAAANKLHERARENFNGGYATNSSPSSSPEKSLIKGAAHRRMQSAHATNGKDLKSYLDGMRSGSPERPSSGAAAEYYNTSSSRPDTPTRAAPRPILAENTPPSASMRAIQSMIGKDETVADVNTGKSAQNETEISTQLHKLTSIATSLQQEMATLSRRSKDNAADLIGLKEAQNERDNDVRKTLRELMASPTLMSGSSPTIPRSSFGLGLLDSKAFGSPTPLPRTTSHNSLIDGDRAGSPAPFSVEGVASVAMLEKIIREMVTKEGQERLLSTLSELMDKSSKMSSDAISKVNDLKDFIKEQDRSRDRALAQSNQALIKSGALETSIPTDMKTLLSKIKDSVISTGGMTAEVKALLRELRGEILGMGRELGRKLDQQSIGPAQSRSAADPEASRRQMQQIVGESMKELRDHMENLLQESARQSSSLVQSRGDTSSEDMYSMVKHALTEHSAAIVQTRDAPQFDKDEILTTVRTACENFKPEIELQQYGLEREEVLEVLKEGLAQYSSTAPAGVDAINKHEVFAAISEALQSVQIPSPVLDTHAIKAEMLASIRECLEDFRATNPNATISTLEDGSTRELINDAIRTGLAEHTDMTSRVMEISRDDLFDAVKAGLDGSSIPFGGFGEQVLQQLHILVDGMKAEFKQYSAANGRDTEQVLDAVKDGLEVLRGQIETYVDRAQDVTGKDEIIDTVRTGLDGLRLDVQAYARQAPVDDRQGLLEYIKSEFEHLHAVIGVAPMQTRAGEGLMSDKSDILAAISGMRSDLGVTRGFSGSEVDTATLESVRDEISHLRETLGPLLIKFGAGADRDDMLQTIKEAIAELPSHPGTGISTDVLEAIRGEFENLQRSISTSGGTRADTEEMLDTIRLGLDDLRSHVDKKIENPEKHILNGEILDTLNEGLDNLRADVNKTLEKPVDMTVTYEILDTLKEGLAGLRADMDKLSAGRLRAGSPRSGEIVLADTAELSRDGGQDASNTTSSAATALDEMKLLLTRLQIKVEAMDKNIQDLPSMPRSAEADVSKEQLGGFETILKDIQTAVIAFAAKEKAEVDNAATKDDTNAIETLMRNTKADVETLASGEQMDAVEAIARVIKDTTDSLKIRVDEHVATKADIAVVEVLSADLKAALDDLKARSATDSEDGPPSKAHIDAIGVMCAEIKDKMLDMVLHNAETMPEKADVEQLTGLVNDLRDAHDKFRETYDKDIGITAQAFDDRKKDTEEIIVAVNAIKSLVEDFKNQACDQEENQQNTYDGFSETLNGIAEKLEGHPELAEDVKGLTDSLKTEFEKAHASLDLIKSGHLDSREKEAEHRDTVIAVVTKKVDDRLDELLLKYQAAEKLSIDQAAAQAIMLAGTRELADELKLSIDTLGTALTTSTSGFGEATEKMAADSKTVFNKVDDVYNKLDETQIGLMGEHQATRQEITKTVEGIANIQSDLLEHNPKVLVSLQELHALVTRHYEHAQKYSGEHTEALKTHAEEVRASFSNPRLMPPAAESTATAAQAFDDKGLHEKLDKLISRETPDSEIHGKLDRALQGLAGATTAAPLLEKLEKFASESASPAAQLERLDAIHAQMMATAAEVSTFVAAQTTRIADSHESREREAEELSAQIARHETRKEDLEADIDVLVSERDELRDAVTRLKTDKEELSSQKSRLSADIQALHAALAIRREELAAMEAKADSLERRVVEGLMDQSRLALLGRSFATTGGMPTVDARAAAPKTTTTTSPKRKTKHRDLRVSSAANSEASAMTAASSAAVSTLGAAMDKIVNARTGGARQSLAPTAESGGRRIMSLGQIHHNSVSARPSLSGTHQAPLHHHLSASPRGVEALKRSQSVRTSGGLGGLGARKSSWNANGAMVKGGKRGFTPLGGILDTEGDKENNNNNEGDEFSLVDNGEEHSVSRSVSGVGYAASHALSTTGYSESTASRPTTSGSGSSDAFSTVTASEVTATDDGASSLSLSRNDSIIASMVAGRVREMLASGEIALEDEKEDGKGDGVVDVHVDGADGRKAEVSAGEAGVGTDLVLHTQGIQALDYADKDRHARHNRGGYGTPTDSGLGSDLPTTAGTSAGTDDFAGYFAGEQQQQAVVAAGQ